MFYEVAVFRPQGQALYIVQLTAKHSKMFIEVDVYWL